MLNTFVLAHHELKVRDGVECGGLSIKSQYFIKNINFTKETDDNSQDLSEEDFVKEADNRKNTIYEKLEEVMDLIANEEYQKAIDKLLHDIKPITDGSLGGNPINN